MVAYHVLVQPEKRLNLDRNRERLRNRDRIEKTLQYLCNFCNTFFFTDLNRFIPGHLGWGKQTFWFCCCFWWGFLLVLWGFFVVFCFFFSFKFLPAIGNPSTAFRKEKKNRMFRMLIKKKKNPWSFCMDVSFYPSWRRIFQRPVGQQQLRGNI